MDAYVGNVSSSTQPKPRPTKISAAAGVLSDRRTTCPARKLAFRYSLCHAQANSPSVANDKRRP